MTANPSQVTLLRALETLQREGIASCILRDGDRLDQLGRVDEVDLLVEEGQRSRAFQVFERQGLRRVPAWGHAPHHFFLAYFQDRDSWLKLDVVTRVALGTPSHAIETSLAVNCLAHRKRCGAVPVPSAEDELITLMLHCVLDKKAFSPHRRRRLQELRQLVADEGYLSDLLRHYWSETIDWPAMARRLDNEEWESFLSESTRIAGYLERGQRVRVLGRRMRDAVLRKGQRAFSMVRPRTLSVAFLAPDGAGKSTLIATLQKSFFFPTHSIYMGLYPKRDNAAQRATLPGLGMLRRLITQWARCLQGRYHRGRGRFVLFDRYCYDASLPRAERLVWWRRFHRWLLGHACPSPDLVVVLDAPGDVLMARKGEHTPAVLEQRRQGYRAMAAALPCAVTVDATQPPEQVCREVTAMLWRRYARRLHRRAGGSGTGRFAAAGEEP